jgi:hypothetical protein
MAFLVLAEIEIDSRIFDLDFWSGIIRCARSGNDESGKG